VLGGNLAVQRRKPTDYFKYLLENKEDLVSIT
jgi:hypothetical protein